MNMDIRLFQKRYGLSNKNMAEVCMCSLPTIQKWRSGDVTPPGPAQQLMRLLDYSADGDPARLRQLLRSMNREIKPAVKEDDGDLHELENSMTKVVDRLELMLETRRKERELAESEARYRSMVEAHEDPVCRWLPDTTLTYVNDAYARMFSEFGDDLIGRQWLEFIPPQKQPMIQTIVSDMVRRGESETMTHESVDKNGHVLYQHWRDIPVKNERGDVVELHSVARDMTELTTLRDEIEESRRIRSNLMSLCEHPIVIVDGDGSFLEMNNLFSEQVLEGKPIQRMDDLVSAGINTKFQRLLTRVTGQGQMLYRLKLRDSLWSIKIRLLSSSGQGERLLAVFDRDEEPESRDVIQVRLASEVILGGQAVDFVLDKKKRRALEGSMAELGKATRVDRIYVFTFDWNREVFDNIMEWCADGIEPHIDELKGIPVEDYSWWVKRLRKKQWIQLENLNKLPRTAATEREILQAQGIQSILVAPFEIDGELAGFVGFDQNTHERVWHSQEVKALEDFRDQAKGLVEVASRSGKDA